MKKCIALLLTGVMLLGLLSGCNTYQNEDSASSARKHLKHGRWSQRRLHHGLQWCGDSEPHYEPELQRF